MDKQPEVTINGISTEKFLEEERDRDLGGQAREAFQSDVARFAGAGKSGKRSGFGVGYAPTEEAGSPRLAAPRNAGILKKRLIMTLAKLGAPTTTDIVRKSLQREGWVVGIQHIRDKMRELDAAKKVELLTYTKTDGWKKYPPAAETRTKIRGSRPIMYLALPEWHTAKNNLKPLKTLPPIKVTPPEPVVQDLPELTAAQTLGLELTPETEASAPLAETAPPIENQETQDSKPSEVASREERVVYLPAPTHQPPINQASMAHTLGLFIKTMADAAGLTSMTLKFEFGESPRPAKTRKREELLDDTDGEVQGPVDTATTDVGDGTAQ